MRISPPIEDDEADIEILEDMGDAQKIWKNTHVDYYIGKRAILCSYKKYIHTHIWYMCVCEQSGLIKGEPYENLKRGAMILISH